MPEREGSNSLLPPFTMKILSALAILTLGISAVNAQTADGPQVAVKSEKLAISTVETPQFQARNVGEKSWRPKNWMEIDLPFQIKLPESLGGRSGSLASMSVTYYIGLNAQTKDNKFEVIKGMLNYVDIPAGESCHALAYVSPASMRRLMSRDRFNTSSDIKAWGYEVLVDGKRIAGDSSTGSPWWDKADGFSFNDGIILAKSETPFGILWGDYDVNVKKP